MENHKDLQKSILGIDDKFIDDVRKEALLSNKVYRRPVVATSIFDGTRTVFNSLTDAAVSFGVQKQNIHHCCKGLVATSCGHYWEYYGDN